jgi:hypothetical protein
MNREPTGGYEIAAAGRETVPSHVGRNPNPGREGSRISPSFSGSRESRM